MHWLNGQCKKGDACEYLHVYQEEKIPACKYFAQEGLCQKGDKCVYRHVISNNLAQSALNFTGVIGLPTSASNAADKKLEECPYYERGMCKQGIF